MVTDWNAIAISASAVPPNSILQSRTLAIAHAAMYDAVRAVERSGPAYAVDAQARSRRVGGGRRRSRSACRARAPRPRAPNRCSMRR